jgi:hypothetical protein
MQSLKILSYQWGNANDFELALQELSDIKLIHFTEYKQ